MLDKDYNRNGKLLPAGSVIVKVNGQPADEFARSLQNKMHLQVDAMLHKLYLQQLLCINPGTDGWDIEVRLPDGTTGQVRVSAYPGYRNLQPSGDGKANVIARELDGSTGYLRIFSFEGRYMNEDNRAIQSFMDQSRGGYRKLIVDIRGNGGGEEDYWANLLVKPLLQQPAVYEQTGSVKKQFFIRFGIRFSLYQKFVNSTLTNKKRYDVTEVAKTEHAGLDPAQWDTFKVTKTFRPANRFSFDGKVYLLADSGTFSAADSFTAAVRKLKLGTVVGTNTAGGDCAYMEPYRYALPNSGLMFKLETDMNFNEEGQVNEIYGTAPDVLLEPSAYPTAYPAGYEKEDLMKDEWIKWVMQDR